MAWVEIKTESFTFCVEPDINKIGDLNAGSLDSSSNFIAHSECVLQVSSKVTIDGFQSSGPIWKLSQGNNRVMFAKCSYIPVPETNSFKPSSSYSQMMNAQGLTWAVGEKLVFKGTQVSSFPSLFVGEFEFAGSGEVENAENGVCQSVPPQYVLDSQLYSKEYWEVVNSKSETLFVPSCSPVMVVSEGVSFLHNRSNKFYSFNLVSCPTLDLKLQNFYTYKVIDKINTIEGGVCKASREAVFVSSPDVFEPVDRLGDMVVVRGTDQFNVYVIVFNPILDIEIDLPDANYKVDGVEIPANIEVDFENKKLRIKYLINENQTIVLKDNENNSYYVRIVPMFINNFLKPEG
jgi:hypothetical protein